MIDLLERQELIQKLVSNGFGDIVEAFMENEIDCYTKKGRLNKCGACRVLDLKTKQLEDKLNEMKELLREDLD